MMKRGRQRIMEWLLSLRNRRWALVAPLLLAVCVIQPGLGVNDRPGEDETIFDPIVIEHPKPVQVLQTKGGEKQ